MTDRDLDIEAVRNSSTIKADDQAFVAMLRKLGGKPGPRAVDASRPASSAASMHGSEGTSH